MVQIKWKEYRDKILLTIDVETFYRGELDELHLQYHRNGYEIKSQCPFTWLHTSGADTNPSLTINLDKGVYYCNSCGSKGNVHTFYQTIHKVRDKRDVWYTLGDALGFERPTTDDSRLGIDPGLPSLFHNALKDCPTSVKQILSTKRGISNETLNKFLIGWDGDRVTIPVYDEFSELSNIRRYKWNSYEGNYKVTNYEDELGNGYGEATVYGIEHLYNPEVKSLLWCEGEWDRLIAEQNGLKACTSTAGAKNFKDEWLKQLRAKENVYICYDNDKAGKEATEYLLDNLKNSTNLYVVNWPENFREKGDITDYFVEDKHSLEDFMKLFVKTTIDDNIPVVHLASSSNAKYTGRRIKVPVLVAGKENAPYIYPKSVCVSCDVGDEERKICGGCSLMLKKKVNLQLTSKNPSILRMIDCNNEQQHALLKGFAGCAQKCYLPEIDIKEYGNLETIHMIPKADTNFGFALHQEYVARSGFIIGNNLPTNKKYMLTGYMHADPQTQKVTYVFDDALPEKDLLDDLQITAEVHEQLKIFQCAEGQTVEEKFNDIHTDLERNITYIWDRRKVAYAVDLIYHSPLSFMFQEQRVKRGWAECLIIGDSGQAKTTLVERLMNHYKCGELLSGESSKRTGLVYNLQQSGKGHWTLMWGAMPLNDGGLITVDELSGMPEDDLAKMSDVRSSGIAKATGVITAETTARTRMIFISNPRNGRQLKAENYGVTAILKLFGKAEDVRRLDFAVGVASGEVDANVVNKSISDMPPVEHKYTSDLCKLRVLWAWSRKPDQIIFTEEANKEILAQAIKMGNKYSSRIPLVEPADQRLKIARLSVAAAACMYSTDDGSNIVVEAEHVDFVVDYLQSVYDSKALGYDRFSADDFENSDTTTGTMARLRNQFIAIPFVNRDVMDVVKAIYQMPYFSRNSLEDATGLDRDELKDLLHFLISNTLVEKASSQDYKRTPVGLAFIEHMLMEQPTESEIVEARKKAFQSL